MTLQSISLIIYRKVFEKSFVFICNKNDQHILPTPVFSISTCGKIERNCELYFVSVQLLGTSNIADGGGPNVKLEK